MKYNIKKYISLTLACVVFVLILAFYKFNVAQIGISETSMVMSSTERQYIPNYKSSARACVLMDAKSGEVLHSENPDAKLPMASTTKIMTALLVIRDLPLDRTVTIKKEQCGIEGSSIYLQAGEELSIEELLYGLLLESGNDAASALAVAHSGSVQKFVDCMNEFALEMGLENTHFENPHGLTSPNHYTSALDLANITKEALRNDIFSKIVATKKYYIPERENCRARYFSNHNKLLLRMESCDGVKTGYTIAAGRCLVSSASDGDSRFIVVTLDDRQDFSDHKYLLEYAVSNYQSVKVAGKGDLRYIFANNENDKSDIVIENTEDVYITRKKDDKHIANMNISINPNRIKSGSVYADCMLVMGEKTINSKIEFKQNIISNIIS